MAGPVVLVETEIGVLADIVVFLEIATLVQPGAGVAHRVFGTSQPVAPSFVPLVR